MVIRPCALLRAQLLAHRGYEVGGSGGHSGLGGGGGESESFGEEGPHDRITGEQHPSAHQPQGNVQL